MRLFIPVYRQDREEKDRETFCGYDEKLANAMDISVHELLSETEIEHKPVTLPENFETPEQAVLWLANNPALAYYGGSDIQKMSPETQLEFAREVLEYMKYLSNRKKEPR